MCRSASNKQIANISPSTSSSMMSDATALSPSFSSSSATHHAAFVQGLSGRSKPSPSGAITPRESSVATPTSSSSSGPHQKPRGSARTGSNSALPVVLPDYGAYGGDDGVEYGASSSSSKAGREGSRGSRSRAKKGGDAKEGPGKVSRAAHKL
jgi:hypothetical protein